MAIPQSFLQDLLARVDVVEVVGRYVQLKKGGANFMGLCPFHGEKSPSFSVSPAKQFFHCFGCGKSGNAIGFLMEHAGMSFIEAVKELAQEVGMVVPEDERSPQERERANQARAQQQSLGEVLAHAALAYQKALKGNERAVDYLKRRGLTGEIAKRFGLGYAPAGWRYLAGVFPDYQDAKLVQSGLVIGEEDGDTEGQATTEDKASAKRYDRFRDRIMFPIRNVKGEHIGFGGRVLDQGEPKYLNSPETPVFHKGHELYGLFEARTDIRVAGHALVTEGYMDVVALAQMGVGQAVATLGTACTPDHVRLLFRFTDTIVFSFDGDKAGRRAARKALDAAVPFATDTRTLKFLFLPEEHDPDSFIRAHGRETFETAVAQATPLSRFLIESCTLETDMGSAEGRAHFLGAVQPLWNALPDGALKRQLLSQIAELSELGAHEIMDLWKLNPTRSAHPTPKASNHQHRSDDHSDVPSPFKSQRRGNTDKSPRWSPRPPRTGVHSRADVVVRLLIQQPQAWGWLSANDHRLLAEWPQPHGDFFAWLEGQWHDHGAQPWAALDMALMGQVFEPWLRKLTRALPEVQSDHAEWQEELTEVLQRMHIERIQQLQTEAIAQAESDPSALQRWRQLDAQLKQLQTPQPSPHS
jgi:DNA primase